MIHSIYRIVSSRLFILAFLLIAFGNSSNSQVIYDVPGTYTWVVPPCVTSVTVEAWGGGAGGGGTIAIMKNAGSGEPSGEACSGAGGGGGGGFLSRTFAVTPGQTYTIVVGAGGTAGAAGNGTWNGGISSPAGTGGTGGTSSFIGNSYNLQATGGTGGVGAGGYNTNSSIDLNTIGAGGTGGTGIGGSVNNTGGNGAPGYILNHSTDKSGAGGGAAGPGGNGGNGALGGSVGISQPPGGIGQAPGGNGGAGQIINIPGSHSKNGSNGIVIGGAGGGALNHQTPYGVVKATGGAGARGEVRISYSASSLAEPLFSSVAPICSGDVLTALPTTSNNGYSCTWSPPLNNSATTTYVFTPDPSGPCADTASLKIIVNTATTPTFTAVAPICNGGSVSALPTTSNNGFSGTWSPALNNTATTIYTFTPAIGQCATTTTLTITVGSPVTPTFTAVAPICNGGSLSALPTTSNNGFSGTWSPALNNTATTVYTFTPTTGQCATSTTLTISVGSPVTPTFTAVAPICNGDALSALPTTSNNGFSGTWSPALNNTATTVYTFTPTTGQCATSTTLTISVGPPVMPTFTTVAPICNGDALSALPTTSNNGFSGTWSPALNNTATTVYTFTPTTGQCATSTTLTISVGPPVIPTFTTVAPICNGDALVALPMTSNNGFSGTWSPALNNTATTVYTFTPTAGQCATSTSLTITVNQLPIADVIPDNTTGLPGLTVNFENNSSVVPNYTWDFGNGDTESTTTLISTSSTYNNPGTYFVVLTVSNGTCTDSDTVQIIIINDPEPVIEVPNVFTPNGDGSNNQFFINTKFTSNIKYIIVNRWGNLIFEADGINPLWDGTSKGKPVAEGVYFYKYEVLGMNGETYIGHGNVTLIRN